MILAGALTLAGITGATALFLKQRPLPLLKNKALQNFILCKLEVVLKQEPVFLQKGQELTIQPNSKTPSYSVYDSNHNLIGRYSDGYGRIFTAKTDGNMYVQFHAPYVYYSPVSFFGYVYNPIK